MHNSIIAIDNNAELEAIESQHPECSTSTLVLLSNHFSLQQLESYQDRKYIYFDQLISKDEGGGLTKEVDNLLWSWFIDEKGQDLSLINGCSLGVAFISSLEILLSNVVKYVAGLKLIFNSDSSIYFSSETNVIFLEVARYLQKDIGFSLHEVNVKNKNTALTVGKYKTKMDDRYRDLATIFRGSSLKRIIISNIFKFFNNNKSDNGVMFFPGGKHQAYFEYLSSNQNNNQIDWILPLKLKNFSTSMRIDRSRKYYLTVIKKNKSQQAISNLIEHLKDNLKNKNSCIDSALLIKILELFVFESFVGAHSYYCDVLLTIDATTPKLVILSGEDYETFILAAQAAKYRGIATAITSHGLNCWGSKRYKSGRFKLFDYALAYGRQDADNYVFSGIEREKVVISSFPYFESFLPVILTKANVNYETVLVLAPDFYSGEVTEKYGSDYVFYREVLKLLNELNIDIIGIKSRHQFYFDSLKGSLGEISINGKSIPTFSGYENFPSIVKNVDFVIGPPSTAIMEANLLGKDYYVYQHTEFYQYSTTALPKLYDYVNISSNMFQLKEAILKRQPYKEGCCINDLIDLEGVVVKQELYNKFESGVKFALDDINSKFNQSIL